jgi:hypothetical protein
LLCHFIVAPIPGAAYFFSAVTYRRRPILCDAPVRGATLHDAVKTVPSRYPFTMSGFYYQFPGEKLSSRLPLSYKNH